MRTQNVDRVVSRLFDNEQTKEAQGLTKTVIELIVKGNIVPENEKHDASLRFIFFLEKEQKEWASNASTLYILPPTFRTLKMLVDLNDENRLLTGYLRTKIEEMKKDDNESKFRQWLSQYMDVFLPESNQSHWQAISKKTSETLTTIGHALTWVYSMAAEALATFPVGSTLDDVAGWITGSAIETSALAGVSFFLSIVIYNMVGVYRGTRSLTRAKRNIMVDGGSTLAGNIVGCGAAALAMSFSVPALGVLAIGAGVSFVLSYLIRKSISDWSYNWFNLPKDERLENAYNLLGVKVNDSNTVVNRAYRFKSRENHPDTLGKQGVAQEEFEKRLQTFLKIQEAIDIIKDSREKKLGTNEAESLEISWRETVVQFIRRHIPWYRGDKTDELLCIKYDVPPLELFEENSVNISKEQK